MTTFTIYAMTNDDKKLCASTTRTDNDSVADVVIKRYENLGYTVNITREN